MSVSRLCSICGSDRKKRIHTQDYLTPGEVRFSYDVVSCVVCGFVYADNVPSQEEYNLYYKNSSKYLYNSKVPEGLLRIYDRCFKETKALMGERHLDNKTDMKILDVGCATGHFLSLFKREGYENVQGVEPSIECAQFAKDQFGITVFNGVLGEFVSNVKYNLVVAFGILEHISHLRKFVSELAGMVDERGVCAIAVPNIVKFPRRPAAPFDEFSIEHINFFANATLENLMLGQGLRLVKSVAINAAIYDSNTLLSFFEKAGSLKAVRIRKDRSSRRSIRRYVRGSRKSLRRFDKKIDRLITTRQPVIVWGVGSLTYRLLSNSSLQKANIFAFVDSNKSIHNSSIRGVRVVSPDILLAEREKYPILIASNLYKEEIRKVLIEKYRIVENIITVD